MASSYFLLAATAVYSLASVPVALHYLDIKRFGLWMVMGTLAGYLSLIDAGMTSAVARLLIDHKDDRNGGNYGGFIQTGWLVSCVQGAIIFVIGLFLAGTLPGCWRSTRRCSRNSSGWSTGNAACGPDFRDAHVEPGADRASADGLEQLHRGRRAAGEFCRAMDFLPFQLRSVEPGPGLARLGTVAMVVCQAAGLFPS